MNSALLLTQQLYRWSGSEMVITELAEEFVRRGWRPAIFAHDINPDLVKAAVPDAEVVTDVNSLDISQFDFIYSQHGVLLNFLDQLIALVEKGQKPKIVFGHLSPFQKQERPHVGIENTFGDKFICNSFETFKKMEECGLDIERLIVFPNPAPDSYFQIDKKYGSIGSVLAVSNHFPKELRQALYLLEKSGLKVTRLGRQYGNKKIRPSDIEDHDMVVSIGKTVQYSIAANRPVFVYDKFGGPGWLTSENFDEAAAYNFSGRCTRQQRTAKEIHREITENLDVAPLKFLATEEQRMQFMLSRLLTNLLEDPRETKPNLHEIDIKKVQAEKDAFLKSATFKTRRKTIGLKDYLRQNLLKIFKL